MKKKILFFLIILMYSVTGCEQPGKTKLFKNEKQNHSNHIIKNVYLDDQFAEDEMEVIVNNSTNMVTIHLDGETHHLKKSIDLPEYTAENSEYRYTNINGEITFLNRNLDMVVFHHTVELKQQKELRKESH